jgi:hypothetical protein
MPFNEAQWIFSFFESDFLTNTNPVSAQLLAIVYPTILSLFSKPDRLPKPEEGFQDHQKSQKLLNPVHLVQKSLGQGSGLPTMKPCCFRANAERRQLNYRVASWETPSLEQPIRYFFRKFQFLLA